MKYKIWTADYTGEWTTDDELLTEREATKVMQELRGSGIAVRMLPETTYAGTEQRHSP